MKNKANSWIYASIVACLWIIGGALFVAVVYGEFGYMDMNDLFIVDAIWWSRFIVFGVVIYFFSEKSFRKAILISSLIGLCISLVEKTYAESFINYDNNYRVEYLRNLEEMNANPGRIERARVSQYSHDWKTGGGYAVALIYWIACLVFGIIIFWSKSIREFIIREFINY